MMLLILEIGLIVVAWKSGWIVFSLVSIGLLAPVLQAGWRLRSRTKEVK